MKLWKDAARRWSIEGKFRAPETIRREKRLLRWLDDRIGLVPVNDIGGRLILDLRAETIEAGWGARSANYLCQTITAILRAAHSWEWTEKAPPYIRPLKTPPGRTRWLPVDQAEQLIAALPHPISEMAEFALETGLRRSNVCGLRWEWIDAARVTVWIPPEALKTRQGLNVPLTAKASAVVRKMEERRHRSQPYVFHRDGRPIWQPCGKAWSAALKSLGIDNFRWHDLRHTWASWHMQAGTETRVLQELGGWRTITMVSRYSHLQNRHTRRAAEQLELWKGGEGSYQ